MAKFRSMAIFGPVLLLMTGLAVGIPLRPAAAAVKGVFVSAGLQSGLKEQALPLGGRVVEQKLYAMLQNILGGGSAAAGALFAATLPKRIPGLEVVASLSGDVQGPGGEEDIQRILKANASLSMGGSPFIDAGRVLLATFMMEDVVFVHGREAGGLHRLTAYVFTGFHLFSFERREVVYSVNFVLPLRIAANAADGADAEGHFFRTLDANAKAKENLQGFLAKLAAQVAESPRFLQVMREMGFTDNPNGLESSKGRLNYAVPRVTVASGADLPARLGAFGGQMAVPRLASDVFVVPSYIGDDRDLPLEQRDWRERNLHAIILNHSAGVGTVFQRLTGVHAVPEQPPASPGSAAKSETVITSAGPQKIYYLARNLFPKPVITVAFRIGSLKLQSRKGKNENHVVEQVPMDVRITVGPYCQTGETRGCNEPFKTVKNKDSVALAYTFEMRERMAGIERSEEPYYGAIADVFEGRLKEPENRLFGSEGLYGHVDDIFSR